MLNTPIPAALEEWRAYCQECKWIRVGGMVTIGGLAGRHNKSRNHIVIVTFKGNLVSTYPKRDSINTQDQAPY